MTLKSFNALSEKKLSDYKPYLLDVSARQCVYVEGTDSLTREQRMALVRTNEVFNVQRQSSTEQTSLTALLAASICEQNAWTEIQPSLSGSLTIRPIPRSPSAGLAMGQ